MMSGIVTGQRIATLTVESVPASEPGPIASLYDRLIRDPRAVDNAERQGRLKGSLSTAVIKGKPLEQWQYEVAGGGRVWYAVSDADTIQPIIDAVIAAVDTTSAIPHAAQLRCLTMPLRSPLTKARS